MTEEREHFDSVAAMEAEIHLYMEARDYERAVQVGNALLKIVPSHIKARDALGNAYTRLGNTEAALRVTADLVRLSPNDPSHRLKRAILYQDRGDVEAAVEELGRVLSMNPGTELADSAREHLEALDTYQLNQIVALARDDGLFRQQLSRDAEAISRERGFFLSQPGWEALRDLCQTGYLESLPPCSPALYH